MTDQEQVTPSEDDGSGGRTAGAPRSARRLVGLVLAVLLVPGVIGFDLWPLTGWRLFSRASRACQDRWVLEVVEDDNDEVRVSLEELPPAYRHAEWALARLPGTSEVPAEDICGTPAPRSEKGVRGASPERRDAVCEALLQATIEIRPTTVELRVLHDRQTLVRRSGDWMVSHDSEEFHTCRI